MTSPQAGDDGAVGLRQVLDTVLSQWRLWGGITLAFLVAALALALLLPPRYEATALIKIDPQQRNVADPDPTHTANPLSDQARIDSEVQIVQSRDIARGVAQKLGLAADPEFDGTAGAAPTPVPEKVTDTLVDRLTVRRDPNTYIVNVAFSSRSPEKAARIANAFVDGYLADSIVRRTQIAARQTQWLDKRLATLGAEVQAQEAQIAGYRARSGLVEGSSVGTVTDQQIGSLSGQVASAESEAAAAQANVAAARQQIARGGIGSVSSVLSSSTVADLRRQRSDLVRQQGEIAARYGAKHPESVRITQQLADNDRALQEESQRIMGGLESQARAASASAGSLRSQLGQLRGEQSGNTRNAVVAEGLERQAKAKQAIYDQLAQMAQQTSQVEQNSEPLATIVERAVAPIEAAFPKRSLFAALGLVLGLVTGLAVVFVMDLLRTTLGNAEQVERKLGIPFIASTPVVTSRQLVNEAGETLSVADYVAQKPMSSYAEAMRTIRSTLMLGHEGERLRTVAITSAVPSEGKTSTAQALGRVMAMSGDKVVLVDCDLRRGGRHTGGAQPAKGLVEYLKGDAQLDEVVARDPLVPGLDLVTLAQPAFTPVDLFSGARMETLIGELANRYDCVLLDTAPVLAVAETRALIAIADTTLFVMRADYTPARAGAAALRMLDQDGSGVLGAILSMVPIASRGVGARDPLYYYPMYRAYHEA